MSSLLVCAQPATGPDFMPVDVSALLRRLSAAPHLSPVGPASRLEVRPTPESVSSGIPQLDALTGGLPRGCLTEIFGPPSSGCTSVLLAALSAATRRNEACALVDVSNAFDPQSADAADVDFQQLLWVRCTPAEPRKNSPERQRNTAKPEIKSDMARLGQALKATDLLLQSGGFGLVAIDLMGIPHAAARRIPLTSWFRFRRAVENTPTVLLVIGHGACARTCASLVLKQSSVVRGQASGVRLQASVVSQASVGTPTAFRNITVHNFPNDDKFLCGETPAHARLLEGISVHVEVERARLDRKPVQSDKAGFETRMIDSLSNWRIKR